MKGSCYGVANISSSSIGKGVDKYWLSIFGIRVGMDISNVVSLSVRFSFAYQFLTFGVFNLVAYVEFPCSIPHLSIKVLKNKTFI